MVRRAVHHFLCLSPPSFPVSVTMRRVFWYQPPASPCLPLSRAPARFACKILLDDALAAASPQGRQMLQQKYQVQQAHPNGAASTNLQRTAPLRTVRDDLARAAKAAVKALTRSCAAESARAKRARR